MSERLGVPAFALLRSPASRRSLLFSTFFLLIIVKMYGTSANTRTPMEASTASQNGLSFIFFMSMSVSLLLGRLGRGRELPRLFADRQVQGDQVPPVVLGSAVVGLEAVVLLRLRPLQVGRLVLDAPEQRGHALLQL